MAKRLTEKKGATKASAAQKGAGSMTSPVKLELLVTVVNRSKAEFYVDLLQGFEVNMQTVLSANGTASSRTMELLGLVDLEKSVILSIIRKDKLKGALEALENKFITVKNGKGIAYTVPLSSTIGVAVYQFLSNTYGGVR